jgi:hypothetical protein
VQAGLQKWLLGFARLNTPQTGVFINYFLPVFGIDHFSVVERVVSKPDCSCPSSVPVSSAPAVRSISGLSLRI